MEVGGREGEDEGVSQEALAVRVAVKLEEEVLIGGCGVP